MSPGLLPNVIFYTPQQYTTMTDNNAPGVPQENNNAPLLPVVLPPLSQATIFLAGFRDCTEEAIKYLIEVENISKEDPLIEGLKQHLVEKQDHIDVAKIVSDSESDQESQYSGSRTTSESEGGQSPRDSDMDSGLERSAIDDALDASLNMSPRLNPLTVLGSQGQGDPSSSLLLNSFQNEANHPSVTSSGSLDIASSHVTLLESHDQSSTATKAAELESQVDLSSLAQNNPIVASLTKELFDLLEGGDSGEDSDNALSTETAEFFRGHDDMFGRDSPMAHE